jgi:hypothetical protein
LSAATSSARIFNATLRPSSDVSCAGRESEKHKRRHSGHFTRLIGESSFCDYLDLFKFRFFEAKKSCHIDDLIRTYEVRGLRAESLYTGGKLPAFHCLRDIQANTARAPLRAMQTEVANNHLSLPFCCWLVSVKNEHASFAVCDPRITHPFSAVL